MSYINVDFNDGRGYTNALWNTPISATYLSSGTKLIKIKIIFSDNSTAECYSTIEVLENAVAQARYGAADDVVLFDATADHSGGTLFVRWSRAGVERSITRPLIVIEGYDIFNVAPLLQDNFGYDEFLAILNRTGPYPLNDNLDDAGYDLIFLDYNNGTDDIRRNAALFQEVLAWVNNQKALSGSTEQNVVLGISMGGLVARYGLASLTKQGTPTETRLLITQDSPHRGANTPLGIQFLTLGFNDLTISSIPVRALIPEIEQAAGLLSAPATRQMLIARAASAAGAWENNTFLDLDYRDMITFSASGPQPTYRLIATSLGSECGIGSLAPYSELIKITGKFFFSPLPISRNTLRTELIVNALPNQDTKRILKFRMWFEYKILGLITVNVTFANFAVNSPSSLLPLDGAPGGTSSISAQVGNRFPDFNVKFLWVFQATLTSAFADDFCFIPTVSALDVTNFDLPALSKNYAGGISPSNPARVNTFIAQETTSDGKFNSIHPNFTARNGEWILDQMESIPDALNCPGECVLDYGAMTISEGSAVCSSGTLFTLNNIPDIVTQINWSATPSSLFTIASGTGTYIGSTFPLTLHAGSGSYGTASLAFTVNSHCGVSQPISNSTLWVGAPTNAGLDLAVMSGPGLNSLCYNSEFSIKASNSNQSTQKVTQYSWGFGGWSSYFLGFDEAPNPTSVARIRVPSGASSSQSILVQAQNACGSSGAYSEVFYASACSGISSLSSARVAPVPADESITIALSADDETEIRMFDSFAQEVFHSKTNEKNVIIPVAAMENGIYYLQIANKIKGTERKRIVVNHNGAASL